MGTHSLLNRDHTVKMVIFNVSKMSMYICTLINNAITNINYTSTSELVSFLQPVFHDPVTP